MKRSICLLLIFLIGCSEAFALPPEVIDHADQYTRVGGATTWARQWTLPTSSGTAGLVLETPADNTYAAGDPHLFRFGTTVRISCVAAGVFAWVMDTGVTIATTGLITDAAATGPGPTFRVEAGTYVEDMPMRSAYANTAEGAAATGRRAGFCTGTTLRRYLNAPCDADADCPGGACRTACVVSTVNYCRDGASPFTMINGFFLQSLGATAADCYITEVR